MVVGGGWWGVVGGMLGLQRRLGKVLAKLWEMRERRREQGRGGYIPCKDSIVLKEPSGFVTMMHQCSVGELLAELLGWCIMPTLQECINPVGRA